MTTTDREDLYQQAWKKWTDCYINGPVDKPFAAVCAVVDLILDARPAERDERLAAWTCVARHPALRQCYDEERPLVDAIVDRISDLASLEGAVSEPAERQPWEVLREAHQIAYDLVGPMIWIDGLIGLADRLEAEHHAAQEKAEREAEREKLIAQAARITCNSDDSACFTWDDETPETRAIHIKMARALADAGFLTAPETTDGGARRCTCGAMRIPADQLSVTDTDTVHRVTGPCYVDDNLSEPVTASTEPSLTRSDDVVQRAREALDGITEGPWESYSGTSDGGAWIEGANGEFVAAELTHEDARFIAAAPDLVRELADELEATRRSEQENQRLAIAHHVAKDDLQIECDELRAEVEELLKVDHQCASVDEAWAVDRAERDEAQAWAEWFAAKAQYWFEERAVREDAQIRRWVHAEAERDDARRERDELRTEVERLTGANAELVKGGLGAAEARDELRATIERVKDIDIDDGCPCCCSWVNHIDRALDGEDQ